MTIRLNVYLDEETGTKLQEYVDRNKVSKVSVVTFALREWFEAQAVKDAIMEKMKDPEQLAMIAERLGLKPHSDTQK